MASCLQNISSGNLSRARKEKMIKWVFQTLAKDRDRMRNYQTKYIDKGGRTKVITLGDSLLNGINEKGLRKKLNLTTKNMLINQKQPVNVCFFCSF